MPTNLTPPPKFEPMDSNYHQADTYGKISLSQQILDQGNMSDMRTAYERELTNFAKLSNQNTALQAG